MMPRVFVTDGAYKHSLAAVRALSSAGYRVTVGEREGLTSSRVLSFWSRHCAQTFRYPDPRRSPEATAAALAEHFSAAHYDAAIPVGLVMVELFVQHRDRFTVPLMLPPADSFAIAGDKRLTFAHASGLGIPIPRTLPAESWKELPPPLVFKHHKAGALVARNEPEAAAYARDLGEAINDYIVQEFIPGQNGFGYFAIFREGREAGYFMHERLMQHPKEGGPSVVARAIRNTRLHELGRTVLESLRWHGVAMVEFKRSDRDGEFYLIEVNPKLWGSLDLAIQSGCNFPVWIVRSLADPDAPITNGYREGLTYQWIIPSGVQSFVRYPELRMQLLQNVLSLRVRTDLRITDPMPAAAGIWSGVRALLTRHS
ncbi:MAG TPA: ATP-grasp domain-containing protein [Candidatus Acidoferrum sp.]|nr:ATP-grasp domain-containing protein [Candidatus Acidoferrum sp.]